MNFERRGSGEPLLLLHGIGGELCVWDPVLDRLAERFDVVALDLPGFGKSPALPEDVRPDPPALARAVAGLMDDLGIAAAHLAGNSLGGWVALELGKTERARSVTALCPAGLWGVPLRAGGASNRWSTHEVARMLRPVLPLLMLSPRARELALAHVVAHPERVPRKAASRMVRSYARATAYEATSTAMRESYFRGSELIRVPLTLAFGQLDRLIRPVRLNVPGARSVVLPDCGHIPIWDDPALVTDLITDTSGRAVARQAA
ncbi:MAG: alpha/beta fold hydrolase [Thermoleophilaceae bacterium]